MGHSRRDAGSGRMLQVVCSLTLGNGRDEWRPWQRYPGDPVPERCHQLSNIHRPLSTLPLCCVCV
jgi:hypothetical protein